MPNLSDITVRIVADSAQAEAALQRVGKEIDSSAAKASTAKQSFLDVGSGLLGMGATLSAGITAPIALIGTTALDAASDLNEAMTAVNTVFGDGADAVLAFADTSAASLGITEEAALSAASRLGGLATGLGFTGDEAAGFSTEIIEAATDLSSFYNVPGADALAALRSGLVGETEPLRQFGILLNEAAVQEEGLRLGLISAGEEMSEQEKVIARQSLILGQLGSAQGDFARTSDGLANSQRILQAEFGNLSAELGAVFLPIALQAVSALIDFMPTISGLISGFQTLDPGIQTAILGFAGLLAAAGPVALAIGGVITVVGALLSPIGLVIAAIAAFGLAYTTNFLGFADLVNSVVGIATTAFGNLILLVQNVIAAFGEGGLGAALGVLGDAFSLAFTNISTIVAEKLQEVSTALLTWFQEQASAAATGAQGILTAVQTAWAGLGAMASAAWAAVTTVMGDAWTAIQEAASAATAALQTTVGDAWTAVQTATGEVWTAIQETVSTAWIAIQNEIASKVDAVRLAITEAWELIQTFLGEKMTAIQASITLAWETIQTTVSGAVAAVQETLGTTWAAITETVSTTWTGIQEAIATAWDAITTTVSEAIEGVKTFVGDGFQAMLDTITTAKEDAIATLTALKDDALALFADASEWLIQAGKDLISGLIAGIGAMKDEALAAVGDVIGSVRDALDVGLPTLDFAAGITGGGGGGGRDPERRQHGGPVSALRSYWVGEGGRELFVPHVTGTILSHGPSMALAGGGDTVNHYTFAPGSIVLKDGEDWGEFFRTIEGRGSGHAVAAGRG